MTNQITQKLTDLLGPVTDDRRTFGLVGFGETIGDGSYTVVTLTEEQKHQVEQLVVDHFKVKKVLWMELPSGMTEDGELAVVAKSHMLLEEPPQDYEGKTGYLYQIMYTPTLTHSNGEDFRGCIVRMGVK